MRYAPMVLEVGDGTGIADDEVEIRRRGGEETGGDAAGKRARRRVRGRRRSGEQRARQGVRQRVRSQALALSTSGKLRTSRSRSAAITSMNRFAICPTGVRCTSAMLC
jgi:hypothetical protein